MLQLEPLEIFPIVRGLETTDGNTNYVQAVVRDAKTNVLIATVNLLDQGDQQLFMATWQVLQDPSGLGRYITIRSSVYTDSGYSVKSQNFGDKYETYLVQRRMNASLGVGGGDGVSYKEIRKIVQEELATLPKPEPVEMPEMPNIPFHLQPILNAVSGLRNDLQAVEIPAPDFSGVEHRLGLIEKAIQNVPKDDDSEVLRQIADTKQAILQEIEEAEDELTGDAQNNLNTIVSTLSKLNDLLTAFRKKFDSAPVVRFDQPPVPEPKEAAPEPIDYEKLLAERP